MKILGSCASFWEVFTFLDLGSLERVNYDGPPQALRVHWHFGSRAIFHYVVYIAINMFGSCDHFWSRVLG